MKPKDGATYYPDGVSVQSAILGSAYSPPSSRGQVLSLNDPELLLWGPGAEPDVTNSLTVASGSRLTGSNKTTLNLKPSTGFFTGTAPNADTTASKPIRLVGVVLQDRSVGCGYFLSQTNAGCLLLKAAGGTNYNEIVPQ